MTPRNREWSWLYVLLSTAGLLLIAASIYRAVVPRLSRFGEPDKEVIASALVRELPPFVQLTGTTLREVERDTSQPAPVFNVRFSARGQLVTTVYLGRKVENGILFLTDPAAPGTQVSITGAAVLRRISDSWTTELTVHQQPILQAVTRDAFPRQRVIIQGSPEEAVYIGQRKNATAAAGHRD